MSYFYSKDPEITEYTLTTHKLKAGESLTLAVISDLHECTFGAHNDRLYFAVEEINPDAVVIPGDFVNACSGGDSENTMLFLKRLKDRYPKIYYGPGNHERKLFERVRYTRHMVIFERGLNNSGVRLMRNESELISDRVRIYSLDLNHAFYRKVFKREVPPGMLELLLKRPDRKFYNILIAHDPDHFPEYAAWGPDLVLSGHVHGGLIRLPKVGGLVSPGYRLFPEYDSGLYSEGASKMIVSRGAGSHTINVRINNPPEILKVVIKGRE